MKSNPVFMAFASGSESKEVDRKLYIGTAPVFVLAVNPDKKKSEELYGTTLDKEPEYLGEVEVGPEGRTKKVPQARISFVVKTDTSKCDGIEMVTNVTFFLNRSPRYNRDCTKMQIIDKYGRTAWATEAEIKEHKIPVYSNGKPANIDSDYRPVYIGEEFLTNFIKDYLNIPSVEKWENKQVVGLIDNPSDAEARLDKIEDYFKGDFSELENILNLQPSNRVVGMFGVKTTDKGQFQTVYTHKFLRLNARDYSKLDKDLQERKAAGSYPTSEFSIEPLHEYKVEATDFSSNDPFGGNAPSSSPWDNWGK